jgi:hypothetical protein
VMQKEVNRISARSSREEPILKCNTVRPTSKCDFGNGFLNFSARNNTRTFLVLGEGGVQNAKLLFFFFSGVGLTISPLGTAATSGLIVQAPDDR